MLLPLVLSKWDLLLKLTTRDIHGNSLESKLKTHTGGTQSILLTCTSEPLQLLSMILSDKPLKSTSATKPRSPPLCAQVMLFPKFISSRRKIMPLERVRWQLSPTLFHLTLHLTMIKKDVKPLVLIFIQLTKLLRRERKTHPSSQVSPRLMTASCSVTPPEPPEILRESCSLTK